MSGTDDANAALDALRAETDAALAAAADLRAWDAVRVAVLGRNGRLTALLKDLGGLRPSCVANAAPRLNG